jgi:hypothetical protein
MTGAISISNLHCRSTCREVTHPETKPRPSGDAPTLNTQLACPFISATAALPRPEDPVDPARTSCSTIRRSSDPENKYCERQVVRHPMGIRKKNQKKNPAKTGRRLTWLSPLQLNVLTHIACDV